MKLPSHGQLFADAAKAFLAMGCFGAMAYFAFVAFTGDQASRPALPVEPDALQEPAPAVVAPLQAPTVEQRQTDQAIAALIDKLENGIARGPSGSKPEENAAALLGRIMTLEASASPDGLNLVIGMSKRFAARAQAAAAAGGTDEARRLESFGRSPSASTAPDSQADDSSRGPAIPASQLEAAVQKDRPDLLPNPVPPASPNSTSAERIDPSAASPAPMPAGEFDKAGPKLVQVEAGIVCPPRDTFENAQAWVHERLKCERHPTPNGLWIEWAEYCPSGPLGYFVLKVKTGQQKVYLFENIPPAIWEGFKAAPSADKFYHSEIKGKRHWFRLASKLKPSAHVLTCHR